MSIDIPIEAQRLIDTHNLTITQAGKAFVVRDPHNRKLGRFEGPELLPLLHQAVAAKSNVSSANYIAAAMNAVDVASDTHTKPTKKKSFIKESDGPVFRVVYQGTPTSPTFRSKGPAKTYLQQLENGRAPEYEQPETSIEDIAAKITGERVTDKMLKKADKAAKKDYGHRLGKVVKSKVSIEKKSPLEWTTGKIGILILKHADKTDADIYAMCEKAGIKTQLLTIKGLRRYFRLCILCQIAIAEETK